MGAGKSTVAAIVAERLGAAAVDTDALVEAAAGRTVAEVFAALGEAGFRALERAAVLEALAGDAVVSLGGGAVLDPATRADLAAVPVVALAVSWRCAAPRIGDAASRPLLTGDPRARWRAVHAAREGLYREVADVVVDTDDRSPGEAAAAVLRALGAPAAG
jgi:shikimate kinase